MRRCDEAELLKLIRYTVFEELLICDLSEVISAP